MNTRPTSRTLIFTVLCLASLVIAGGYLALARQRQESAATGAPMISVVNPEALAALREQPRVMFVSTAVGDTYGRIALAPLDAPDGLRFATTLGCDRVHFAAGQGFCLGQDSPGGFLSAVGAYTFDAEFRSSQTFPWHGSPSRVRVSPDGQYAARTVFVTGHTYSSPSFSTHTVLIDMASGITLGDLEQFTVFRDRMPFRSPDFNFWGVTFARDSNRFYASLGTGGKTYLVEGDVLAREARVLHEGVECPSLSPDNSRLAFKKRVAGHARRDRAEWQLYLLDVATLVETPLLAEARSVDDQVVWLDDDHILYAIADDDRPPVTSATNIWLVPVDGSGPPRIFVHQAHSPAVIR
jgi:hypothetical protein